MSDKDLETKQRILNATIALIDEGDVEDITVRQIAERAEVGIGSINYHFQSKDKLINQAIWQVVGGIAQRWYQPFDTSGVEPETRLHNLFKETAAVTARYPKLSRISIAHELTQGDFTVQRLILPLMREIFGGEVSEFELRLVTYMLVATFQAMYARSADLPAYLGVDVIDAEQREKTIDAFIDLILRLK